MPLPISRQDVIGGVTFQPPREDSRQGDSRFKKDDVLLGYTFSESFWASSIFEALLGQVRSGKLTVDDYYRSLDSFSLLVEKYRSMVRTK